MRQFGSHGVTECIPKHVNPAHRRPGPANRAIRRFQGVPDSCSNWIEAVAAPFSNIEKHSAIFGICGTDVWRNQPYSVGIGFHALPPAEVSEFEANGLGAG